MPADKVPHVERRLSSPLHQDLPTKSPPKAHVAAPVFYSFCASQHPKSLIRMQGGSKPDFLQQFPRLLQITLRG